MSAPFAWTAFLATGFATASVAVAALAPPPTPRRPVTNEYFGQTVVDPYRWLENGDDPAVAEWTRDENAYTRGVLDQLPARKRLERQLTELHAKAGPSYYGLKPAGHVIFAGKRMPPKEQPVLVVLEASASPGSERILLDPTALDASGKTSIESYFPSPDGSKVAVILAQGGSEQGSLQVYDAGSGAPVDDRIPRVAFPTGGASVAWDHDGSGLFYTRYPAPGERPGADLPFFEQIHHHRLHAEIASDTYVIGREFPRTGEAFVAQSADGRYLRVSVQRGDGGEFAHWLRGPDGNWSQLADFADGVKTVLFGPDDWLYLFSTKDAPNGRILRVRAADADLSAASVVVPKSAAVIEGYDWRGDEIVPSYVITADAFVTVDVLGGPSQIRVFSPDGTFRRAAPLPPVSAVDSIVSAPGGAIYFRNQTYITPPAWYRLEARDVRLEKTSLADATPVAFDDVEVVREFATSKDGTQVPLNIIRKKGLKLDGTNPVLLTGYGGFGVTLAPRFLGIDGWLWLNAGGVYAVANLRGGGEFGEAWHEDGRLTHKQNVFDDFAACARHLFDRKYTNPDRLAIEGGSNGGLLMGAALTQHPDLFRAVVSHVGIYDMLRVERDANGAFNVPEYGSVTNRAQFGALRNYSPYQHVVDGTRYPAVLLLAGANDGRVNPYHSRKMAARMQAATTAGRPVLLRMSGSSGHGYGTALSERIAQAADVFAFLFHELGMRAPGEKGPSGERAPGTQ